MRYWWVNQKQTYRHEIGGGFMWSPKRNANGGTNPSYELMKEIHPGDIVFSYVNKEIIAVGIAMSSAFTSNKPIDFGKAGEVWSKDGWKIEVDFRRVETRFSPHLHMNLLRDYLPEKYSPLQANGRGNQAYLFSLSHDLGGLLMGLLGVGEMTMEVANLKDIQFDEEEQAVIRDSSLNETMRSSLVQSRRGQGVFRTRVSNFERECRVTGVDSQNLLIASHIKPWSVSNNEERLSGHNGLFLSPHIDKLFDSGLMTFENSGRMVISPKLDRSVLVKWGIDARKPVKRFGQDQAYFLEHHRNLVFQAE